MGNSFVLFDVSIVIPHGQFHCGNRGHTQNTDFPWVKSDFPVGKRSSGTATNTITIRSKINYCLTIVAVPLDLLPTGKCDFTHGKSVFCM